MNDVIKGFPETFGLRAFPGRTFRINPAQSYESGGEFILYTDVQDGDGWLSFCKGTPSELQKEITA